MTAFLRTTAALLALAAAAPALADRPARREVHQQDRIAQGIQSGQLTPREAARLEHQEARLDREIRHDRATGGGLSPAERARIERQQDRVSRRIHAQKHDAQAR